MQPRPNCACETCTLKWTQTPLSILTMKPAFGWVPYGSRSKSLPYCLSELIVAKLAGNALVPKFPSLRWCITIQRLSVFESQKQSGALLHKDSPRGIHVTLKGLSKSGNRNASSVATAYFSLPNASWQYAIRTHFASFLSKCIKCTNFSKYPLIDMR